MGKQVLIKRGETIKERIPIQSGTGAFYVTQSVIHPENTAVTQFRLGLIELEPGQALGQHRHNCDEMMFVLEGQGVYGIDGIEYAVEAGDSVYVAPNVVHGNHRNTGTNKWRYLYVVGQRMSPCTSDDMTLADGTPVVPKRID